MSTLRLGCKILHIFILMQVDFCPTLLLLFNFTCMLLDSLVTNIDQQIIFWFPWSACVLKLIVGTQGNDQSIAFQVSTTSRESLQPLSSICSGSEPFRQVEHLAVRRRWNIRTNKYGDSNGEWSCVSVVLIFLSMQLLSKSRLLLQLSSIKSTF